jgi:hypothetical protein
MKKLDLEKAKRMVTAAGPSIDDNYDITKGPWIFGSRTDIAVFQRDAENGFSYGRTVWYVAYDKGSGVELKVLHDTGRTHDNCHTLWAEIVDGVLEVKIGYGGFEKTLKTRLFDLGLR